MIPLFPRPEKRQSLKGKVVLLAQQPVSVAVDHALWFYKAHRLIR